MTREAVYCDHFVFASAASGRDGTCRYGIAARSPGVGEDVPRLLGGHLYPLGVDQGRFARSSSLIVLDDGVAFTQARNAGPDSEGRPDSIYSHTVMIQKDDFEALGHDTRAVAMQCPRDWLEGDLRPLKIRPMDLSMDFSSARRLGISRLRPFLEAVFSGKSVAVRGTDDADLLPDLLSLLPSPLRLVPFTTLLADPRREHPFRVVQTDAPRASLGGYTVIDAGGAPLGGSQPPPLPLSTTMLDTCVGHLARMIEDGDEAGIASLYGEMDELSGLGYKERLCAAAGAGMYEAGLLRSPSWARDMARLLDSISAGRAAACFARIERFLPDGDRRLYAERYGARLVVLRHAGRRLDAAAFAEMLDQCGDGRGPAAGDLVRALLEQRPGEMRKAGVELLSSAASRREAQEVADAFAASPQLRPLILDALRAVPILNDRLRQSILVVGARALLSANSPLIGELFGWDMPDLRSKECAQMFCHAVRATLAGAGKGADLEALASAADAIHGRVSSAALGSGSTGSVWLYFLLDALSFVHGSLAGALGSQGAEGGGEARQKAESSAEKIAETIGAMRAPQRGPPATASSALWLPWFWPRWFRMR